jgi:hypothetical protein
MWRILSRMAIGKAERRLAMAKVIDFYTPPEFRKKEHWVPVEQREPGPAGQGVVVTAPSNR